MMTASTILVERHMTNTTSINFELPTTGTEELARALGELRPLPSERVPFEQSVGRILRDAVPADRALPACNRSRMDGYALRAADLVPGGSMPVCGEVRAGEDGAVEVPVGSCVKIATGAPLPVGLDTVIEHERSDRGEPVTFDLDTVEPWRSVHREGVDTPAGAELIASGTRIRAHHVGLMATVGCTTPVVARLPKVGVFSSGDELVGVEDVPLPHQVREGNAPMIAAMLAGLGTEIVLRGHAPDEREATRGVLEEGLERTDLLVTIGGISAGDHDLVRPVLEELGVRWWVAGIPIRPGKPVHIGRTEDGTIVACLPGNPVSSLVTAHLFCRPIINAMTARTDAPGWEPRQLAEPVREAPRRTTYRPVRLLEDGRARIPAWQGSGDLAHLAHCTGMVELPAGRTVDTGTVRHLDWRTP